MDGYLLLARCPQDDIPLGLFATAGQAFQARAALKAMSNADLRGVVNSVGRRLFFLEVSQVHDLAVVRFRNREPVGALAVAGNAPEDEADEG